MTQNGISEGLRTMSGLPDILAHELDVVFCGLNPGLRAADAGHHFDGRGNRFWPVLFRSGFTPRLFQPADDRLLLGERYGLTTVVARPTASADEISVREFGVASATLKSKIETYKPRFVAFLGKKAYGAIVDRPSVEWGRQTELFGGTSAWVLPNPSGRNRGFSFDELVLAYRALKLAARAGTKRNSSAVGRQRRQCPEAPRRPPRLPCPRGRARAVARKDRPGAPRRPVVR
jgi:TDG/mug DNA glycosylase family protein